MKKLALTVAIVLGLSMTTFADGGGLFQRGSEQSNSSIYGNREGGVMAPALPNHGLEENQNAPLGTGIAILLGLSAAYLVDKHRKQE